MDKELIQSLLQQGSYFALFVGLGYWFLTTYLPRKDEDHRTQMAQLQSTFKESLDKVVDSFQKNTESINARLEIIETDIGKIKKK
jgi:Tfp pilus assembly protein PilO